VEDKYGEDNVCGKLVSCRIDKCIFFSRINDEKRCNLYLNDVKKIIKLSEKLETYIVDKELMKEENDKYGRKIIKNRFRILDNVYSLNEKEIIV
jgi:hypothetical protein